MFCRWPVFVIAMAASISGCSKAPEIDVHPSAPATSAAQSHAATASPVPELSADDQALADKQKVCAVGDGSLGSMGTPVKVMIGDRAVFLCCEHCREALEKDPQKYLAKLDAAADSPAEVPAASTTEAGTPATETPAAPAPEAPATPTTESPAKPE